MNHRSQRRAWLLAAAASMATPTLAGAATDDSGSKSSPPVLDPNSVGPKHNDGLDTVRKLLNNAAVNSEAGMSALLGFLKNSQIISVTEATVLVEMINAKSTAKSIGELSKRLQSLYKSLPAGASATATALASLAASSAQYAEQFDKGFGIVRLSVIVFADFSAGLMAAANCVSAFPALVPFAVLFGAGSGSGLALYATMPKIDPVTQPLAAQK
jgi:hypothetical protein